MVGAMRDPGRAIRGFLILVASLATTPAHAQGVQLAPFVGYQFGGSFRSDVVDGKLSLKSALDYGGTIDFAISKAWRVELLYSRQETEIDAPPVFGTGFDLTVERYMVGVVEEKTPEARTRFFGAALAGVTRFVPGLSGFDKDSRFTLGIALGFKTFVSDNLGLRWEGRGYYTFVEAEGGVWCTSGSCLFAFGGSGLWQADLSAGLILAF
jgi:hypothetical protein